MSEKLIFPPRITTTLTVIRDQFPDFFWKPTQLSPQLQQLLQLELPIRKEALDAYTTKYDQRKIVIDRQVATIPPGDTGLNIVELTVWWMCLMKANETKELPLYHGLRSSRTASHTPADDGRCWCIGFVANAYLAITKNIRDDK